MKSNYTPHLQKHRQSGIVRVKLRTLAGTQWISTGQTSYDRAREVCDRAMLDRLQMAADANALTPDFISRFLTGRSFTCEDILAEWKAEAEIDLAPDTLAAYHSVLRQWLAHADCSRKPLSAVNRWALNAFVNEKRVAVGTRKGRLAALRSFYKFASASGKCVGNLADLVKVKTRDLLFAEMEPKETLPITEAEYRTLMASPRVPPFWRAATALGYWLGYRLRDAACLQPSSVQVERIVIYQRKTGARLELSLDDPLLGGGELRAILAQIMAATPPGSPWCFPLQREIAESTTRKALLSVQYGKLLKRHGIHGKRFHGLRHSAAMRFKAAGLTMEEVAERLGHRNTKATEIYTNHTHERHQHADSD